MICYAVENLPPVSPALFRAREALTKVDDDTIASGSSDKTVRLWRPAEARCMHQFKGHKGAVQALQTHRGLLLSGSADQSVKLWDLAEGGCVGTLWQPSER